MDEYKIYYAKQIEIAYTIVDLCPAGVVNPVVRDSWAKEVFDKIAKPKHYLLTENKNG
jgi:hypothetical protein